MTTDSDFQAAEARGQALYERTPHAVSAIYVPSLERILILLDNGLEVAVRKSAYPFLSTASAADMSRIEINAGGFEVYFPAVDEGIWIPNLLGKLTAVQPLPTVSVDPGETSRADRNTHASLPGQPPSPNRLQ